MSRQSFWIFICLLGWTALQATDISIDSLEASTSALHVKKPVAVPIEQPFAFVYNDNAKTTPYRGRYLVAHPIVFNSQGPSKKIAYDFKTGELIVPEPGTYEVTYSTLSKSNIKMFLEVNGSQVNATNVAVQRGITATAVFVLQLAKEDRVALAISLNSLARNKGVGTSASLSMRKL
jgi:hypothetical protein